MYYPCSFLRVPTLSAWGIAGGLTVLYLTDWKVIMKHVPFVGKKYEHEKPH